MMLRRFLSPTLGASLILVLTAAVNPASAQVTFNTTTYPSNNLWYTSGQQNSNVRADLNSDGREDFISENYPYYTGCSGQFVVSLSTGDGAYAAPVCYTIPSSPTNAWKFAVGDFYGTGILDVAVVDSTGNIFIYKNSGNGALTLASTLSATNQIPGFVAADVNHDGHIDLVSLEIDSSGTVYTLHTLLGNGDGTFTAGPVSPAATGNNVNLNSILLGDFDGDGHGDLLIFNQVFYGDGKGDFTPGPSGTANEFYLPADVNADGVMDLIGVPYTYNSATAVFTYYNYLDLIVGHYNRTPTAQKIGLKGCAFNSFSAQTADFDGDGLPDLIVPEAADCNGNGPYTLNFMKGNGNGTFQPEQVIYSTPDYIAEWHVMRASHSSKPDLTVFQYLYQNRSAVNPEELVLVNTTTGNFPSCTPLNYKPEGIAFCGPTSTVVPAGAVNFSFAGSSPTPARDMELWIDGKKVAENLKNAYSHYDFLNSTQTLSAGQHEAAVFSVGWDYSLLLGMVNLNVGATTCPVPTYTGLNVCAPIQNGSIGSPVTAWASGNAGGPITRMEVWVDGVKQYSTFGSNTLKTSIAVAPGWHQFAYFLVSINGTKWLDIVNAQVK